MKGKHDHQLTHAAEEELELIGGRGEVDDELEVLELGWGGAGGGGGGVSWADGPAAGAGAGAGAMVLTLVAAVVLSLGRTWSWSLSPMSQCPWRPQMKYLLPSELSEITVSPSRYAFNGCDTRHISKSDFPTSNTSWTGVYVNTAYIYYLPNQATNNYIFIISSTSTTTITPSQKKKKNLQLLLNYTTYIRNLLFYIKYRENTIGNLSSTFDSALSWMDIISYS